jgi:hypothetical protein
VTPGSGVLFDPDALARTAAYVAALPGGLDAYPTCRVRTAVTREITDQFPSVLDHPGIDSRVRELLRQSLDRGTWMPDAHGMAVRLLVRDAIFQTDEEYQRWYYEVAARLFAKPFYRVLMYVVSPTLVMLGAEKRWAAFREGSTLTARIDRNVGNLELKFPAHLYPEVTLRGFGEAFRASLAAARARNPRVELVEARPDRGRWAIGWM